MKRCVTCTDKKRNAEFNKAKANKDGLTSSCRACLSIYNAKRHRDTRRRLEELVGHACTRCHQDFPFCALDLHHRDTSVKDKAIGEIMTRSWAKIKVEVAKCDLLCACCHRIVHEELRKDNDEKTATDSYTSHVIECCESAVQSVQLRSDW